MKRLVSSLAGLVVLTMIVVVAPAFAAPASTMTDHHIDRIKSNCGLARATLGQIHANDAPVYINRNQAYFTISDKLMARMNSRLALGRYDTAKLAQITSDYNKEVDNFKSVYKDYDMAMTDAIRTDCTKEPVGFYDKVDRARDARKKVHEAAGKLSDLIDDYRDEMKKLQEKQFPDKEKQ